MSTALTDDQLVVEFKNLLAAERTATGKTLDEKVASLRAELDTKWREFLAKTSRPAIFGATPVETLGQRFTASQQFKSFLETGHRSVSVTFEGKAGTPLTTPPYPTPTQRLAPEPLTHPPLTLRSLLRPIGIRTDNVEYVRQKPSVGAAAIQYPQATLKAQTTLDFELATANVITTAVWTEISRQTLSDDAQLAGLVDGELQYLVDLAEEIEILNGPGGAGHMTGLLPLASVFPTVSGTSAIDTVGGAIATLQALGYPVSGTLLNPNDWVLMQQAKATGTGTYLLGEPGRGSTPSYLWNLPVALSANIPEGTFLTGGFGSSGQLLDREARLEVSYEDRDVFVRNAATVLCERRSGLLVRRPTGFLKGALTAS